MTQELRDLMHRVADDAPPVHVAEDTWARARRSRRRERVAVPTLVAALVLGAGALGLHPSWLTGRSGVAPAAPQGIGEAAVPDHVYAVPDRLDQRREDDTWSTPREPMTTVRRASVGYVTRSGGAVLVSARDGVHHLVDLPGFNDPYIGMHDDGPALALSPDGRRLAYAWRQRVPGDGERVPSGLAVVDLGTGEVRTHRLRGGLGVRVGSIGWSPDSRWLVYRAAVLDRVEALGGFSVGAYRLERLDTGTGARTLLPRRLARVSGAVAVSPEGEVAVAAGTSLFTWPEDTEARVQERPMPFDLSGASAWAADGRRIALGSIVPTDGVTVARPRAHSTDSQGGVTEQVIQVLGWAGPHQVVAVRHPATWEQATLDLLPVHTGQERTVAVVDAGVDLGSLTVATDLMSPGRPTAEFAAPEWAQHGVWWWVGGGVLALLVGAAVLLVVRRRA